MRFGSQLAGLPAASRGWGGKYLLMLEGPIEKSDSAHWSNGVLKWPNNNNNALYPFHKGGGPRQTKNYCAVQTV